MNETIKWISVKDRLPPEDHLKLVSCAGDGVWFGYLFGGQWFECEGTRLSVVGVVTWWAEIPEGPEEINHCGGCCHA